MRPVRPGAAQGLGSGQHLPATGHSQSRAGQAVVSQAGSERQLHNIAIIKSLSESHSPPLNLVKDGSSL